MKINERTYISNEKKFYTNHDISLDITYMNESNYSIIAIKKRCKKLYYEKYWKNKLNKIVKSLMIIKRIKEFLWKIRIRYCRILDLYNYRNKKSK